MSKKFNINFVSQFKISAIASLILVGGSIAILLSKGLTLGVDFRGGAEIQVKFQEKTTADQIRSAIESTSSVQSIGAPEENEFLIKVPTSEDNINQVTTDITKALESTFAGIEIRKTDIVGPKAGKQLQYSGAYALLIALVAILIYIGLRFDFKYAPGAVVALFHDVIIICGIFALTGREFGLQIVGALLAVIGYSVNDTVVVYDRVREHEDRSPGGKLDGHINLALNETLTRTMLTSATTLFVALAMFYFGGGIIHDFFFAIVLGVIIGTYSSLYVAAPTVLFFSKVQKDS
jgi:preprotein translocase subunit SecF